MLTATAARIHLFKLTLTRQESENGERGGVERREEKMEKIQFPPVPTHFFQKKKKRGEPVPMQMSVSGRKKR